MTATTADLLPHLAGLHDSPPAPSPWQRGRHSERTAACDLLPPRVRRLFAAECARVVLPVYEARHPGDSRPAKAVSTAVQFALGLAAREELRGRRRAAYAAYAAAYADAAAASYAAAYASAADAATAASDAAYAASAASAAQWRWAHRAYTAALGEGVVWRAEWRTDTARALAHRIALTADFSAAPILADALQDAGCELEDVLDRLRGRTPGAVLTRADVAIWQTLELTGEEPEE